MEVKFKRAEDSLYPQIYYTFTAKDESDELTDYYVQDLTEQYFDEAIDVIARYLMPEETFSLAARIPESETAVNGFRNFYRKLVEQKLSLACFKKGSDNIVAVNVLIVEARGFESSSKADDPTVQSMQDAFDYVDSLFSVANHYNVDHFLYCMGLTVSTKYRGRRIATEMLKARIPFMKALGLKLTSTIFTGAASQKIAATSGFVENVSISFEQLQEHFPQLDFSHASTSHCKTMSLLI